MSVQTLERPPEFPPPPDPAPPASAGSGAGGGRRGWRRRLVTVVAIASLGIGSGLAGGYAATGLEDQPAATVATTPVTTGTTGTAASGSLAAVAAAVAPSVVSITVRSAGEQVEGSGVVLDSDGLIVTNAHVVAGAGQGGRITVDLSDGRTVAATVVGTDQATDLAVLQAQGVSGLKAATFSDSDTLEVGDTVLAVGNSLGLEGSVTAGIVSALHRSLTTDGGSLGDAIQTDASINPGNSGGPLVNSAGKVVGITTANASVDGQSSGSIGVGFAIPGNRVEQVVNQLTGGVHTVSASASTG
jgi:putative serine protease PepD